jgi:hypothetical protein
MSLMTCLTYTWEIDRKMKRLCLPLITLCSKSVNTILEASSILLRLHHTYILVYIHMLSYMVFVSNGLYYYFPYMTNVDKTFYAVMIEHLLLLFKVCVVLLLGALLALRLQDLHASCCQLHPASYHPADMDMAGLYWLTGGLFGFTRGLFAMTRACLFISPLF